MSGPLDGLGVWCTRPGPAGERSCERLARLGANVIHVPTLKIEPVDPAAGELESIRGRAEDMVVALTSPAGVENFVRVLTSRRPDGAAWNCGAVGARTAERARELGLQVVLTSPRATAADLAPAVLSQTDAPVVLVPGSNLRRPELAARLRDGGREVIELVVQETTPLGDLPAGVRPHLEDVSVLVAFSPSALEFVEHLDAEDRVGVAKFPVAAMGSTTAARARELGLSVVAEPDRPGEDGLIDSICRWYGTTR